MFSLQLLFLFQLDLEAIYVESQNATLTSIFRIMWHSFSQWVPSFSIYIRGLTLISNSWCRLFFTMLLLFYPWPVCPFRIICNAARSICYNNTACINSSQIHRFYVIELPYKRQHRVENRRLMKYVWWSYFYFIDIRIHFNFHLGKSQVLGL